MTLMLEFHGGRNINCWQYRPGWHKHLIMNLPFVLVSVKTLPVIGAIAGGPAGAAAGLALQALLRDALG